MQLYAGHSSPGNRTPSHLGIIFPSGEFTGIYMWLQTSGALERTVHRSSKACKFDSYPMDGGDVSWPILLRVSKLVRDNAKTQFHLAVTHPWFNPSGTRSGVERTVICVSNLLPNHSYIVRWGEEALRLRCLLTTHGPIDLITHTPPDLLWSTGSYLMSPLAEAVPFFWLSLWLLLCTFPVPFLYLPLYLTAPLHHRGTWNTELCMLLWVKQTKRISLYKELMLGFLHTQPPSSKDLRARASIISSVLWMGKLTHEKMK